MKYVKWGVADGFQYTSMPYILARTWIWVVFSTEFLTTHLDTSYPYIITLALAYLFENVLLLCLEGAEFAVEEPFLPGLLAGVAQTHVLLQRLLLLLFLKEETSHEALYLSPQLQNDACATIPFGGGLLSLVLTLVYSSASLLPLILGNV